MTQEADDGQGQGGGHDESTQVHEERAARGVQQPRDELVDGGAGPTRCHVVTGEDGLAGLVDAGGVQIGARPEEVTA